LLKIKDGVELKDFQLQASEFACSKKASLLSMKTGVGKSVITLDIIRNLLNGKEVSKFITVGTKSSIIELKNDIEDKLRYEDDYLCNPFIISNDETLVEFFRDNKEDIALLQYESINRINLGLFDKCIKKYKTGFAFDECLSYNNKVLLSDGSKVKIGDIVSKKLKIEVMSHNKETGILEPKKVTGWFRNSPKHFNILKTRLGGNIQASDGHKFYTSEGYKELRELKKGDSIYINNIVLNDTQEQLILGTLLGDGYVNNRYNSKKEMRNCRLTINHGLIQKDYVYYKYNLLKNICGKEPEVRKNGGYGDYNCRIVTKSLPCLKKFHDLFYKKDGKRVTQELLDKLKPEGLAFWFMDDGSCSRRKDKIHSIAFHTQGFIEKDNLLIIDYFKNKWGISFILKEDSRGKGFYLMSENMCNAKKFIDLVKPYFIEGILDYKVNFEAGNLLKDVVYEIPTFGLIEDVIISISKCKGTNKDSSYDIEVEDNHNYFAGNGNILVSNCHKLKNPKALLTRSFYALRKDMYNIIFLTATPLTTSLIDLFYQIHFLDTSVFKNKNAFVENFINMKIIKNYKTGREYPEIVSYKNLPLLRERIKDICFDYYPEQDTHYIIHKTKIENIDKYIEASEGLFDTKDAKIHAVRLIDLQKVVDKSHNKVKLWLKAIHPHLKEGLITYCHFHETVDTLSRVMDKLNIEYRVIHGQISTKERKDVKTWFNSDPSNKVLLITSAGSQSLNLQSVNNMFFYNIPFGFGGFSQAKGRIERLFSKHTRFNIHFILTEIELRGEVHGTIDYYKHELISSYGELTSTVFEANEVPKSKLQTFNRGLMNKLKKQTLWLKK
jgi:hypothetical protein